MLGWAEGRRILVAEAIKEGKTLEQKMADDLQEKREQLKEEIAELTRITEEANLRYTEDKQGLRRRMEKLRTQMDKTEAQINESRAFTQTLLYGGSRGKNGQEEQQ